MNSCACVVATTATPTKTSFKNIISFYLCYFAIISTRSTCTKTANYPGTKLLGMAFKRMKNSLSSAHVLAKSLGSLSNGDSNGNENVT